MAKSSRNVFNKEFDYQELLSPTLIRRQSTYHGPSFSDIDHDHKVKKKIKGSNIDLTSKLKIKKTPTNALRNIYGGYNHNKGLCTSTNDLLLPSNRENYPKSILKKKLSLKDISTKGVSFSYLTSNCNHKENKEKEDKVDNKGENKTVSFGQENDRLVMIYEPKNLKVIKEVRNKDKAKCKCDCYLI